LNAEQPPPSMGQPHWFTIESLAALTGSSVTTDPEPLSLVS
jgi:hypothetical protein